MTEQEAEKRLEELYLALKYSSQVSGLLTVGERIMVNQERAALYRVLDPESDVTEPPYEVSAEIEEKITNLNVERIRTRWRPQFF